MEKNNQTGKGEPTKDENLNAREVLVFDLRGCAVTRDDRLGDSPPSHTSIAYPYTFTLEATARCALIGDMSIWAYSPHVQNVIDVIIDSKKIASIRQHACGHQLFHVEKELLSPGGHRIEFVAHYELDGVLFRGDGWFREDLHNPQRYWLLIRLSVYAEYAAFQGARQHDRLLVQ